MNQKQVPANILIIGAGPAGLAVAGRLRKKGCNDFLLLEQSDKFAHAWHQHYDRLCLHTVKQLSHLPHLPFPESYPLYVPREDFARYCEHYARHFQIEALFGKKVIQVTPVNKQWLVKTNSHTDYLANTVIFATGVNRIPTIPHWPGEETFKGDILHSKYYKNPDSYQKKRVLVIGMGNTGAELSLDLAEQGVDVSISVRTPVNVVPRDLNGRPTQLTAKMLAKLPFGLGDQLGVLIRKRLYGDLSKYQLPTANIPPARQLRETGKTPVIDLGTIRYIKEGKIKVYPDIDHFTPNGLVFSDGRSADFDQIILATGYKAQLEDMLGSEVKEMLDKNGYPEHPIGSDYWKGLFFVGFDNYKLGGILGTIMNDSERVVEAVFSQNEKTA